jgi:Xaa-Pro aminopeptidase
MKDLFIAEFFVGNRVRLRQLVKTDGPIVITAAGQLQRGSDSTYPFHQDANFWYLTGIDEPDVVLVMDGIDEFLILPKTSDYQSLFDGKTAGAVLVKRSGIKTILNAKDGWQRLEKQLKQSKQVAMLEAPPAYIEMYGMFTNPARAQLVAKLKGTNQKLKLVDVRTQLAGLRAVKQPAELKAMQEAINLTAEAILLVKSQLPKLKYEYEIEAEITRHFLVSGADNAWKPTVSAGRNACVLHYHAGRSSLKNGELVVIDIGAEVEHYAADITRTLSIGQPTGRQKTVHTAVQAVQDFALGLLKPGALIKDNEKQIEHFMGERLQRLGLIKTITPKAVRKYFTHATSHFLGLEPHDAGDYAQPLKPGMVLTCEPGIYIREEAIGVRIEDDVLITPTGCKVLSQQLSRALL